MMLLPSMTVLRREREQEMNMTKILNIRTRMRGRHHHPKQVPRDEIVAATKATKNRDR
jgi:hypothetical protein